jgi:hypothetical protein
MRINCEVPSQSEWRFIRELYPLEGATIGRSSILYLFLLCAEAFSTMLKKGEQDGLLAGVKVCNSAPSISHLLFADDSNFDSSN